MYLDWMKSAISTSVRLKSKTYCNNLSDGQVVYHWCDSASCKIGDAFHSINCICLSVCLNNLILMKYAKFILYYTNNYLWCIFVKLQTSIFTQKSTIPFVWYIILFSNRCTMHKTSEDRGNSNHYWRRKVTGV